MNTTVTPKLNFFRHGNDLKNWKLCKLLVLPDYLNANGTNVKGN